MTRRATTYPARAQARPQQVLLRIVQADPAHLLVCEGRDGTRRVRRASANGRTGRMGDARVAVVWVRRAARVRGRIARRTVVANGLGLGPARVRAHHGATLVEFRRAFRAARGPVVVRGRGSPGDNLEIDRLRERRARARRGSARANDRANFSASEEYRGKNPRARSGETKSRARAAMAGASEGSVLFCAGQRC